MDPTFEERKPEMERLITVVMQMWQENPGNWKHYVTDTKEMSMLLKTKLNMKVGVPKIKETWGHLSAYIQKEETWIAVLEMFNTDFLKNIDFNEFHNTIHQYRNYRAGSSRVYEFVRRDLPPELRITPRIRAQNAVVEFKSKSNPAEVIAKIEGLLVKEQSKATGLQMNLDKTRRELSAAQSTNVGVVLEKDNLLLENERLRKENEKHLSTIDQHVTKISTLENELHEALEHVNCLEEEKRTLEGVIKDLQLGHADLQTQINNQKEEHKQEIKKLIKDQEKKRKHQESVFEKAMKDQQDATQSRFNDLEQKLINLQIPASAVFATPQNKK